MDRCPGTVGISILRVVGEETVARKSLRFGLDAHGRKSRCNHDAMIQAIEECTAPSRMALCCYQYNTNFFC